MADEPAVIPPAQPAPTAAPDFVDNAAMAQARELTRLNTELAKAQAARDAAQARTKELEGAVDQTKQTELEKQIADLSTKNAALEAEAQTLKDASITAARSQALTGKVASVDAALKLLDADKHTNKDGSINAEAFLTDYPFLAATPAGPVATAPNGGGGPQNGGLAVPDMAAAVASGDAGQINAAFDAQLAANKR